MINLWSARFADKELSVLAAALTNEDRLLVSYWREEFINAARNRSTWKEERARMDANYYISDLLPVYTSLCELGIKVASGEFTSGGKTRQDKPVDTAGRENLLGEGFYVDDILHRIGMHQHLLPDRQDKSALTALLQAPSLADHEEKVRAAYRNAIERITGIRDGMLAMTVLRCRRAAYKAILPLCQDRAPYDLEDMEKSYLRG